jgi:hypothetical protein
VPPGNIVFSAIRQFCVSQLIAIPGVLIFKRKLHSVIRGWRKVHRENGAGVIRRMVGFRWFFREVSKALLSAKEPGRGIHGRSSSRHFWIIFASCFSFGSVHLPIMLLSFSGHVTMQNADF